MKTAYEQAVDWSYGFLKSYIDLDASQEDVENGEAVDLAYSDSVGLRPVDDPDVAGVDWDKAWDEAVRILNKENRP